MAAERKKTKTQSKTTSSKSAPKAKKKSRKEATIRVTLPASMKDWVKTEAKKLEMTQSEFVATLIKEKKNRSQFDFVDQISKVIRDEFAKLQSNLQKNIKVKVVSNLQNEIDDAVETVNEALTKSKSFVNKVATSAKASLN